MTLDELDASPEFQALSYQDQTATRQALFDRDYASTPEYQAANPLLKQEAWKAAVERAPAYAPDELDSPFAKQAAEVAMRLRAGDPKAVEDASGLLIGRNALASSFVGTLAAKGIDAVAQTFDPERPHDAISRDFVGLTGDKTAAWLEAEVERAGGKGALDNIRGWSTAAEIGLGFVETALTAIPLVGTAAKGGALTAKLFGEAGSLAKAVETIRNPALLGVARSLAPGIAESAAYGVFGTVEDLTRRYLQDKTGDPKTLDFWGKIALDMGTNTLTNFVGWGAIAGISTVAKALVGTAKRAKLAADAVTPETVSAAIDLHASPEVLTTLKEMPLSARQEFIAQDALRRSRGFDTKGDARFAVEAQSRGWQTKFGLDDSVTFTSIADSASTFTARNRSEAAMRLAEMVVTGSPAIPVPEAAVRSLAATASSTSRVTRQTVAALDDTAPLEDLVPLISPVAGRYNAKNIQTFAVAYAKRAGLGEDDLAKLKVRLVDSKVAGRVTRKPMDIVLPATANGLEAEKQFSESLMRQLDSIRKIAGGTMDDIEAQSLATKFLATIAPAKSTMRSPSFEGLAYVAESQLGATLRDLGHGKTAVTIGGKVHEFPTLEWANYELYDMLVQTGRISPDHIGTLVRQDTGLSVRRVEVPIVGEGSNAAKYAVPGTTSQTVTRWEVGGITRDAKSGKTTFGMLDSGESLAEIMERHPEIDIRLPASLAPRMVALDPGAGKIILQDTVIQGSSAEALEFLSSFKSSARKGTLISSTLEGATLAKVEKVGYIYENARLGTSETFRSVSGVKKALERRQDTLIEMETASSLKGFKQDYLSDGRIALIGPSGVEKTFGTLAELEAWHAATPMPTWMQDVLGFDENITREIETQVADVVSKIAAPPKTEFGKAALRARITLESFLAPPAMALSDEARLVGDKALSQAYSSIRSAVRFYDGARASFDPVWRNAFGDMDRKLGTKITVASQWPESVRSSRWQAVFGEAMPEKAKGIIAAQRTVYDELKRVSGIDAWKHVTDYIPRIRQFVQENPDFLNSEEAAAELVRATFKGNAPTDFALFAEKLRASDLIRFALLEDAREIADAYTGSVFRHAYLEPVLRNTKAQVDTLLEGEHRFSKASVRLVGDTMLELHGAPRTNSDAMMAEAQRRMGNTFLAVCKKTPILRGLVDAGASPELVLDRLNHKMTIATQATKPWAPLRNFFQINLLSAVHGTSLPWKVAHELVNDEAKYTAIVRRMTRSGAVAERLPTERMKRDLGVWQRMMRWNENMDVFTRAVAWSTAEKQYVGAAARLRAGTIDLRGFARETHLGVLNVQEQDQILKAVASGTDDVGIDVFANATQALTMFDYSKVAKPMVGRGTLGKLFGKFMTYPSSSLALYVKMATTGNVGERIGMMTRLIATSTATYEAFKLAGIDYKGFQWTDPFGFQGGPGWSLLVDGTSLLGTDLTAKMARNTFLDSVLRVSSPGYAFGKQLIKAFGYLDQGDVKNAAIVLSGAPVLRATSTRLFP